MKTHLNRSKRHPKRKQLLVVAFFLVILSILSLSLTTGSEVTAQEEEPAGPLNLQILKVDSTAYPTVRVTLAAWDETGPLAGLNEADFHISVEGKAPAGTDQATGSGLTVTPATIQGLQVALALDTSMPDEDFARLQTAARRLIAGLNTGRDRLALLTFGDAVKRLGTGFTNNVETLETAAGNLTAEGDNTALHQALIEAAALIETAPAGRKAVMVITDRHDNAGTVPLAQVIDQVQAAGVPFFIIGFGDKVRQHHDLKDEINITGGQYMTVDTLAQVWPALETTVADLKRGYSLTFTAQPAADGRQHPFKISLSKQDRQAQAEGTFVARPGEVIVNLPDLADEPLIRGPIYLAPEVEAPGRIVSVTYLVDGRPLAEVQEPPYAAVWDSTNAEPGPHPLTVQVLDSVGNQGQGRLTLTLARPVRVSIPQAPPAQIEFGRVLTIEAAIQPRQEDLQVDLLWNGQRLHSLNRSPYRFQLDSQNFAGTGPAQITIRAEDKLGQTDQESLWLDFLPPPDVTWLQQTGRNFGIAPAAFERGVNLTFDILTIWLAGQLVLLAGMLVLVQNSRIRQTHRLEQQQRFPLEIINEGNVASRYDVWARDEREQLQLKLSLDDSVAGPSLEPPSFPSAPSAPVSGSSSGRSGAEAGSARASTPVQPDSAGPPAQARQTGPQFTAPASSRAPEALGCAVGLAGLLRMVGRLLPGFLGRPFRVLSSRLGAGQSAVRRATQLPGRTARQVNRLGQQAAQLRPTPPDKPAAGSSSLPQDRSITGPVNRPPATGEPASVAAPAAAGPAPASPVNGVQPAANSIRTPSLGPGETLLLGLTVTPRDPYQTRTHRMTIITRSVAQARHQPTWIQEPLEIAGLPPARRYRPLAVVAAGAGLLILVVTWIALWLIRFDIVTWLTVQGQRWFGLV